MCAIKLAIFYSIYIVDIFVENIVVNTIKRESKMKRKNKKQTFFILIRDFSKPSTRAIFMKDTTEHQVNELMGDLLNSDSQWWILDEADWNDFKKSINSVSKLRGIKNG